MPDAELVDVYRQLGSSPDPNTDELLGTDVTVSSGQWNLMGIDISNWTNGDHILYAVSEDLAGNRSIVGTPITIKKNLKGLLLDDWDDGKINVRDNFETRAYQDTEPSDAQNNWVSSRPVWTALGDYNLVGGALRLENLMGTRPRMQSLLSNVNPINKPTFFEYRILMTTGFNKGFNGVFLHNTADSKYYRFHIKWDGNFRIVKYTTSPITIYNGTWSGTKDAWLTYRVEFYNNHATIPNGTIRVYEDGVLLGEAIDTTLNQFDATRVEIWSASAYGEYVDVDWIKIWQE